MSGAGYASKVVLLEPELNLGFGRACNLGAAVFERRYILFLNPDALLYQGVLSNCLEFMNDPLNSQVGICGVQLLDEAGQVSRSCARFPSAWSYLAHSLSIDRVFPQLGSRMSEWAHTDSRYVDHVIGAFYLVVGMCF